MSEFARKHLTPLCVFAASFPPRSQRFTPRWNLTVLFPPPFWRERFCTAELTAASPSPGDVGRASRAVHRRGEEGARGESSLYDCDRPLQPRVMCQERCGHQWPRPCPRLRPAAAAPSAGLSRRSGSRSRPRAGPRGRGEVEQRRGQPGPPGHLQNPGPADRQTTGRPAVTFQTPEDPSKLSLPGRTGEVGSRAGRSGERGGRTRSPQGPSARALPASLTRFDWSSRF